MQGHALEKAERQPGSPGSQPARLEADVHRLDPKKWEKEAEKKNGARSRGKGGVYIDRDNPERRYLFKQDDAAYNIAEFCAHRLSWLFNPLHNDLFAEVHLAFAYEQREPDNIGDRVFVTSKYLPPGSRALYQDIYEAINSSEYAHLRDSPHPLPMPESRPVWPTRDTAIAKLIWQGRYHRALLAKIFFTALVTKDMDVHSENIQVTSGLRPARIDFGGALRNFNEVLDLYEFHNPLWDIPNYFTTYPNDIFESREFLQEAISFSCFPGRILNRHLPILMEEIATYYGPRPLYAFAELIGAVKYIKNVRGLTIDESTNKDELLSYITVFLSKMMEARALSAEKLAADIAKKLQISTEEVNWMKTKATAEWNRIFQLETPQASPAENKDEGEKEQVVEAKNDEESIDISFLAIRQKLREMSSEFEDKDSKANYLLTLEAERLYAEADIKYFISTLELTEEIDKAIHRFPAQAIHLHLFIHEAMILQKEKGKQAVNDHLHSLFSITSESNDSINADGQNNWTLLFDLAKIGVESCKEEIRYLQSNWPRLLADNKNAKSERMAVILLGKILDDDVAYSTDQQLIALLAVLAFENKLPGLRSAIINEFRDILGNEAFELESVITAILVKSFNYDQETLRTIITQADVVSLFSHWNEIVPPKTCSEGSVAISPAYCHSTLG